MEYSTVGNILSDSYIKLVLHTFIEAFNFDECLLSFLLGFQVNVDVEVVFCDVDLRIDNSPAVISQGSFDFWLTNVVNGHTDFGIRLNVVDIA